MDLKTVVPTICQTGNLLRDVLEHRVPKLTGISATLLVFKVDYPKSDLVENSL